MCLLRYKGAVGNNEEFVNRSSGTYIFRNDGPVNSLAAPEVTGTEKGVLVDEVYSHQGQGVTQVGLRSGFLARLKI